MGNYGYLKLSRIRGILVRIALKLWAYSGIVLVICFLIYYFYGGYFAFALLVFALTGFFYHAQDNFLYYPDLPTHSRVYVPIPTIYGLPYENINVVTPDGISLHMFFIHQPRENQLKSPTIVFLHGNAGNIGHRLQNCVGLYHNLNCNILLVEYRGFGLSQGSPSEEGLYIDARTSIDYLYTRNDINHSEIIVFGRSLGGAVAIDLASRADYADKIWCLIVENTFTSIPEMARVLLTWRFINYIPLFLYKNKFSSYYKVLHLRVPTLFVSGMTDALVPSTMMSELHGRCRSATKQLLQFPTGSHNETWTVSGYYHGIAIFLQHCRIQCSEKKSKRVNEEKVLVESVKWGTVVDI